MDPFLALFSINEWLGQPELASEHASTVSNMLELVHWFMLVLFVFWFVFFGFVLIRFRRKRHPVASYHGVTSHFSTHIEVGVVIVEVVLLLFFAFPLWSARVDEFPVTADVAKVRAVGEQFRWNFHYPGEDGLFGMVSPARMTAANPLGLVREDPNSEDDFISPELQLPKDKQAVVQITSKDVIHNLALHPFWIQADAIPGTEIPLWFVPNKTGQWDIVCAQLCGAGHAKMVAQLRVVEAEEYGAWYTQRSAAAKKMSVPAEEGRAENPPLPDDPAIMAPKITPGAGEEANVAPPPAGAPVTPPPGAATPPPTTTDGVTPPPGDGAAAPAPANGAAAPTAPATPAPANGAATPPPTAGQEAQPAAPEQ